MEVNFIICEDDKEFVKKEKGIVNQFIFEKNITKAKMHTFTTDSERLERIIDKPLKNKIYLLDIKFPHRSGIEIGNRIREQDYKSAIIFVTGFYDEYKEDMLVHKLMFVKVVNKRSKNYELDLFDALEYTRNRIEQNNILVIQTKTIVYKNELTDVLYLYSNNRKTYVVTLYETFDCNKSLKELFLLLNEHFVYSHKACIVNLEKIRKIIKRDKLIYMVNNHVVDLVSQEHLKEIIEKLDSKIVS